MNTRQYYYLSTIANYGNLSHAAQALHISPSALSKFLAECERTFGFALFRGTTAACTPPPWDGMWWNAPRRSLTSRTVCC